MAWLRSLTETRSILVLLSLTGVLSDSGSSGCGGYGYLTSSRGFIKSHSDHDTDTTYRNNRDCSWTIEAPTNDHRIRVDFMGGIDIEDHSNCEHDYLAIYDGFDWTSREIGSWCGTGSVPTILSSGPDLYIEFVTDQDVTATGFKLRYEFYRDSVYTGCYTDEFECGNQKCVDKNYECDGFNDCGDNSDEKNCQSPGQVLCLEDEFLCADSSECIPMYWSCDGQNDCDDGSDELDCVETCSPTQFTCGNGACIRNSWTCDTDDDCGDGSDESSSVCDWGCLYDNEFQCKNNKCVPKKYLCDGDNDCGDGSDERNCTSTTTTATARGTTATPLPESTPDPEAGADCGGPFNLTGSSGTYSSANYPSNYPHYADCLWTITAPEGQRVELTFEDFQLETGSLEDGGSRSCKYDYVSIYEKRISLHSLIGRYCGLSKPSPVVSEGNKLVVQFISDDMISKKGFQIKWKAVSGNSTGLVADSGCVGTRELTANSGTILSHSGVGVTEYGQSECVWYIPPSPGMTTALTFHSFNLEQSSNCQYDSLRIYLGRSEQSALADTLCGSNLPHPMISGVGFYLVFKTDDDTFGYGFNISYTKIPKDPVTTTSRPTPTPTQTTASNKLSTPFAEITSAVPDSGCGSPMYRTKSGTIQSQGYGTSQSYDSNLNCSWIITAPPGKQIHLVYEDFNLEYESTCGYDDVSIYDGRNANSNLLQRSCGDSKPQPVQSTSNVMCIKFLTDEDTEETGFKAAYTFVDPPKVCRQGEFTCKNGNCIAGANQCDSKDDCGDNSDELSCFAGIRDCGIQDPQYQVRPGNTRVVGGTEAAEHSWPWQAMVSYNWDFTCGGTLIHPEYVVTAAHCLENRVKRGSMWSVYLGKHEEGWEPDQVKVGVSKVIEYPHYDQTTTDSDIALLKLSKPVKFNAKIKPACLPSTTLQPAGTKCYVTGWGDTKGTGNSGLLKQAAVPTVSRSQCNSGRWYGGDITSNMFCAGYPNGQHDGCEGDSGGPLSCEVNGRYVLEGVVSWGIGCGLPQTPGVYATVPNFVDWIKETIENN